MDYIKIPRQLIYKDRRNLEDFVEEHEELEPLIDNMISNWYFGSADGKERVLRCFNTAYYLCTLILLCDKHAEWNFAKYCDIANCNDNKNKVYKPFTLSLVYIFLTHTYYEIPCKKLVEKLKEFLVYHALQFNDPFQDNYYYWDACEELQKDLPEDWLLAEEFKPRTIDNDIYHDVDKHDTTWYLLTDYYRREVVEGIVNATGKDESEKHILIELIRRDAERFYGSNGPAFISQVKPMLDEMDKKVTTDHSPIKQDFEEKVDRLMADVNVLKEDPKNDSCEELKKQLAKAQSVIEKQELEIQEFQKKDEGLRDELKKVNDERDKLADELKAYMERNQNRRGINRLKTAHLGMKLAPKLGINVTNKKDLAPMLSKLFGWGQNSLEKQMSHNLPTDEELELADIFGELSPELAKYICKDWKGTLSQEGEAPQSK